jgi:hypothetical protein
MKPHFKILNNGTTPVDLSTLAVRYYFTADGSTSLSANCDYAQIGCGSITQMFHATTGMNADTYAEVTFASGAGTIAVGSDSGEIQSRFHDSSYAVNFTQTNDYSFDATKTAYGTWDHMTIYQGTSVLWGTPP